MTDDKPQNPDFVPYDTAAVLKLIHDVFPRGPAEIFYKSLNHVPMRTITRWIKGESRVPPKLVAKLEKQRELKNRFDHEVRMLYAAFREEGMLIQVARSALLDIAHDDNYVEVDDM
ncbi:hypothetical protein [Jiella sp. M17.18]|uniref:hypothetical protein n=1 Tax=Jiella sp. M17.18 TaxID=3234247 RepID=UPI0034DE1AF3